MRILVTGRTGQVGSELIRELRGLGTVQATSRSELDLSDAGEIARVLHELRPVDVGVRARIHHEIGAEAQPDDDASSLIKRADQTRGQGPRKRLSCKSSFHPWNTSSREIL